MTGHPFGGLSTDLARIMGQTRNLCAATVITICSLFVYPFAISNRCPSISMFVSFSLIHMDLTSATVIRSTSLRVIPSSYSVNIIVCCPGHSSSSRRLDTCLACRSAARLSNHHRKAIRSDRIYCNACTDKTTQASFAEFFCESGGDNLTDSLIRSR